MSNGRTEVGENYVWAYFYAGSSDTYFKNMSAKLIINKADYDISSLSLDDSSVTYDGKSHSLELKGTLPTGLTYTKTGDSKTDVGTYPVTVKFNTSNKNYNVPNDLTATLTITSASYDSSAFTFDNLSVGYDGNVHSLELEGDLPSWLEVTYSGNGKTASGEYVVTATLADKYNNHTLSQTTYSATLTITSTSCYTYTLNSKSEASITGLKEDLVGAVVLGPKVDGHSIISIAASTFQNQTGITSFVFEANPYVSTLPKGALAGCPNIEYLELGSLGSTSSSDATAGSLGYFFSTTGYSGCKSVTQTLSTKEVTCYVPKNLQEVRIRSASIIYYGAFSGFTTLTDITLDGTTSINQNAFKDCTGLINLTLKSTYSITFSTSCFSNCTSFKNLYVTSIDSWVKNNFTNPEDNPLYTVDNLYVGNTLVTSASILEATSLNPYCFAGYRQLKTLVIGDQIDTIHVNALRFIPNLESLTLPPSMISIYEGSLKGLSSLKELIIPFVGVGRTNTTGSNTVLGFIFGSETYDNSTLVWQTYGTLSSNKVSNYIPTSLKSVTVTKATFISSGSFNNCSFLESINLNEDITQIYANAFYNCTGLTSIVIPSSVTSIDSTAFTGCTNLSKVFFKATAEPFETSSIFDTSTTSIYYYSEVENTDGYHWHYVDNVPTIYTA